MKRAMHTERERERSFDGWMILLCLEYGYLFCDRYSTAERKAVGQAEREREREIRSGGCFVFLDEYCCCFGLYPSSFFFVCVCVCVCEGVAVLPCLGCCCFLPRLGCLKVCAFAGRGEIPRSCVSYEVSVLFCFVCLWTKKANTQHNKSLCGGRRTGGRFGCSS